MRIKGTKKAGKRAISSRKTAKENRQVVGWEKDRPQSRMVYFQNQDRGRGEKTTAKGGPGFRRDHGVGQNYGAVLLGKRDRLLVHEKKGERPTAIVRR